MPLVSKTYQGKWIKASDLMEGDAMFTIRTVKEETLGRGPTQQNKLCVYFHETVQALALNRTNASTLAAMLGDDTDGWRGHSITLIASETTYGGETVDCVRVKAPSRSRPRPEPSRAEDVRYSQPGPRRAPAIPPVEPAQEDNEEEGVMEKFTF